MSYRAYLGPCNICPVLRMALQRTKTPIKNEETDGKHVGSKCNFMQKAMFEHFGDKWRTRNSAAEDEGRSDGESRDSKRHKPSGSRSSYAEPRRGRGRGQRGRGRGRDK